jgi:DNA-binding transcriptional LysR family regulator
VTSACDRPLVPLGIELRHLRYFLVVSEELHFGRAAERLYIAQPPLSQAIRRLEEELGVVLFERTSRMVALTNAGQVFAAEARKVVASLDGAIEEARTAGGIGARLRIGSAPLVPIEPLRRLLVALERHDPLLRPEVTDLLGYEQVKRRQAGDLDLGIFPRATDFSRLGSEPLLHGEPLAVFLRVDHPLSAKRTLGPAELAGETLVTFPRAADPGLASALEQRLQEAGYRFAGMHEIGTNVRDWILAAAEGSGVAILPSSAVGKGRGAIVLGRPLEPPVTMPDTVVAWRLSAPARLRPVIGAVREVARHLYAETEVR